MPLPNWRTGWFWSMHKGDRWGILKEVWILRRSTIHSPFNVSFYMHCSQTLQREIFAGHLNVCEGCAAALQWPHSPYLSSALNKLLSLTCTSNGNATNSWKNNRFFCRKCVLCGFLVPAAFRPQSSEKEAALTQAAQTTWSFAGPQRSQSAASPCCTALQRLALPSALNKTELGNKAVLLPAYGTAIAQNQIKQQEKYVRMDRGGVTKTH